MAATFVERYSVVVAKVEARLGPSFGLLKTADRFAYLARTCEAGMRVKINKVKLVRSM